VSEAVDPEAKWRAWNEEKFPNDSEDSREAPDALAVRKQVGERIRARRREIGMDQAVLAQRLEVGRTMLSKYESGAVSMRMEELPRLATALGVSVSYFFAAPQARTGYSIGIDWDKVESHLLEEFRRMKWSERLAFIEKMHIRQHEERQAEKRQAEERRDKEIGGSGPLAADGAESDGFQV
jgi:transcriptional regulator with XRE-family HTH domain